MYLFVCISFLFICGKMKEEKIVILFNKINTYLFSSPHRLVRVVKIHTTVVYVDILNV